MIDATTVSFRGIRRDNRDGLVIDLGIQQKRKGYANGTVTLGSEVYQDLPGNDTVPKLEGLNNAVASWAAEHSVEDGFALKATLVYGVTRGPRIDISKGETSR